MKNLIIILSLFICATSAWAEGKYSIKQMTPQVQEALNNRRDRFEQLRVLKAAGDVGENNKGYVEVLKHNSATDALVSAENHDRQVIYQTIAEQNGIADNIAVIERVFAQVQRDKAQPGEKVQDEGGSWSSK